MPTRGDVEIVLLAAVPSLAPEWARWLEDRAAYRARFPDEELTDEDRRHEFLWLLAQHMAARLHEAEALFAALEQVYLGADLALADKLTVGFLENLIMGADDIPGALPVLDGLAASAGPRVRQEYHRARDHLRGPPGTPDDPCWVRP
jgi:hypothetical protein